MIDVVAALVDDLDPDSLVLLARSDKVPVGYLVSSATRMPIRSAVLRSIYVDAAHHRRGVARSLTDAFLEWARVHECVEARVDSYLDNEPAQRFYQRNGFKQRSVSRVMTL